ncbi:hypothetical protein SCHPADRAFT_611289 [Schizopora paradoxa]|uniref:Uncharacterized protein n=1 Tax=Schizopora paradoxa TaxID=27342 RepID=A0A0H2R961_9AGAM|nr:hypothetical protein SCHPADRAFT_611289 [Schizopora paradoxa]
MSLYSIIIWRSRALPFRKFRSNIMCLSPVTCFFFVNLSCDWRRGCARSTSTGYCRVAPKPLTPSVSTSLTVHHLFTPGRNRFRAIGSSLTGCSNSKEYTRMWKKLRSNWLFLCRMAESR